MLLSTEYNIKMPKKYKKILCLYVAYNQTFFFLAQKQVRQDCVAHVDLKGRILFQFTFDKAVESCGMLSDRQGIVIQSKNNCITIFDLETYKIQRYPHQFMDQESDRSKIHTFSDIKLLCIEEKGKYGNDKLKLSYYYYPFQKGNNRPCTVYQSRQGQYSHEYEVFKANNASMICWWKPLKTDSLQFFYFDFRQNDKGSLKECHIQLESIYSTIGYSNFTSKMEIGATHIWEFKKGIFFIICMIYTGASQKKQPYTRYLLYDTDMFRLREGRFGLGVNQDYVINCYNLGKASVFMTYEVEGIEVESSVIYYIDHQTEAIVSQETWQCNNNTYYQLPGFESGLICQGIYALEDVQKFTLFKKRLLTAKEMYTHVIMESCSNLDEILLMDVLKNIYYSSIEF